MKVLTFSIDPSMRLGTRESTPPVTLNLLPLFWTPRVLPAPQPANLNGATCPRHVHVPLTRNLLQARLSCVSHTIRRTNHSSYKNHAISTTQNGNGTWIAAFGRRYEDAVRTGGNRASIVETAPQLAEVIALADAQIEIDDRQPTRP